MGETKLKTDWESEQWLSCLSAAAVMVTEEVKKQSPDVVTVEYTCHLADVIRRAAETEWTVMAADPVQDHVHSFAVEFKSDNEDRIRTLDRCPCGAVRYGFFAKRGGIYDGLEDPVKLEQWLYSHPVAQTAAESSK